MANTIIPKTPHKLAVWLTDAGLSSSAFAERLGLNPRTVDRWIEGSNFPSLELAQRVHAETDGYVSIMDWPTEFVVRRRAALSKTKVNVKEQPRVGKGSGRRAVGKAIRKPSTTKRAAKVR